ncbi:hypothetical protein LGL08_03250 [Clostridium estertheticum]|uniref:hypothetical protein n=1 Tax=Clostridium estertheticum TaxID=238834 RepID=UPI001CF3248A|nr:hypothetical protein [Clostridium estertheticum]MCB2305077.1 hypothetical protein [Clostridium estertheticum]MCB2343653.1 hypothetical protein [Clostridium estertheticum]MCB2348572.1 hypothetical protein [Clostridium estertheticum]WAG47516.1 hypothetical protein LL127_08800 [Clostridium estertheticum]
MKKMTFLLYIILSLLVFAGCNHSRKLNILNFEAGNVENINVYHFNSPTDAKGIIVTKNQDIKRIMETFSEIKIERDATPEDETVGGTVTSFRFNLKDGKKFEIAYWDSILRNPNDINYKVSAKSVENLWGNLAYDKNSVNKRDLPVINKIK